MNFTTNSLHMLLRRRTLLALGITGLAAGCASSQGGGGDDNALRAAIDGAQRGAANRARDVHRHPYETLRFFGIQPTHTVLEASPGGGWYTEILAPYLRERGKLIAAGEARDDTSDYKRRARLGLEAKLAAAPALYDRVMLGLLPRSAATPAAAAPGSVDLVLTFRNLHNWVEEQHLDATLAAFHSLLRPGGVLGVVEHRAPPGRDMAWVIKNGYVPENFAIERARAAGFTLAARSEVNANPRDTRDHPNGVWSLPPALRGGDVDRARFVAIGESDRFTHRYVKS